MKDFTYKSDIEDNLVVKSSVLNDFNNENILDIADSKELPANILSKGFKISGDPLFGQNRVAVKPGESIQQAINAVSEAGGGIVILKEGTHTLLGNISGKAGVSIAGEGRDISIIACGGNAYGLDYTGTLGNELKNFKLTDLTLKNSNNTAGIEIDYCDYWSMENVRILSCDQKGLRIQHSSNFLLTTLLSDNNKGNGFELNGDASRNQFVFSVINCRASVNGGIGFSCNASNGGFLYNYTFLNAVSDNNTGDGFDFTGGNIVPDATIIGGRSDRNGGIGYDIDISSMTFVGCFSDINTGKGWEISQARNRLIGCYATGNSVEYDINSSTAVIGSYIPFGTTTVPSDEYSETDTLNTKSWGNIGGNTRTEKLSYRMKNTSGGTINAGEVVTFKAVAGGDEVTTTINQGDDLVFGMALISIANNTYGPILTYGYTKLLKVNGTTDIAIGDFIGTFTTAGIGMKAVAGDMAIAIALEAYTTDDSNGVIDALFITPRKI